MNQPCPFCRGALEELHVYEATTLGHRAAGPARFFVICRNCSARGPGAVNEDLAWAAWNRRACPAVLAETPENVELVRGHIPWTDGTPTQVRQAQGLLAALRARHEKP